MRKCTQLRLKRNPQEICMRNLGELSDEILERVWKYSVEKCLEKSSKKLLQDSWICFLLLRLFGRITKEFMESSLKEFSQKIIEFQGNYRGSFLEYPLKSLSQKYLNIPKIPEGGNFQKNPLTNDGVFEKKQFEASSENFFFKKISRFLFINSIYFIYWNMPIPIS